MVCLFLEKILPKKTSSYIHDDSVLSFDYQKRVFLTKNKLFGQQSISASENDSLLVDSIVNC